MLEKLKTSQIPAIRQKLADEQNGICLLCELPIDKPCLDHHHKTGFCRGVLCRSCNVLEGRITNSLVINRITPEKLHNILKNYEAYQNRQTEYIHPKHGTKKRRKKKVKKDT